MVRFALSLLLSLALATPAQGFFDFDPDWYETGTVGIGWGDAATTVGDVNGDGYSDILIGSPAFGSDPYWSKGKISLYYGSPSGPGSAPNWEYTLNLAFQQLGSSIAPAGDMNADGFADFVVGAPGYSNGHNEEGRLYFFLGGPSGPVSTAQAEINEEDARLGHSLAFAGDVNGDGYDDVVAGAPGWGGYGAPFYIPVQGRAYVFYGGPGGPSGSVGWSRSGGDEDGEFGWDVAGLGDVNGDGFSDIMVGKPMYDPGVIDTNHGAVYCYYGSAGGPTSSSIWSQVGAHAGDEFGRELAFAGDFNGDGFADALIGVPDYNGGAGGLYIASGGPTGLGAAALLRSGYSSSWGGSVSTIGDFNGDGRTDIVIGGGVDDDAYVYFGDLFGGLKQRILGTQQFATTVASAGDVNGDGLGDFLVTDPLDQLGAGSVRIYLGGRDINYSVPLLQAQAGAPGSNDELGGALAHAGDVNGDGFGDSLVGSPGAGGVGRIGLYYGSAFLGNPTAPNWTAMGDGPSGRFGAAVSTAGDVNGDGYADFVATDPERQQVKVFHGSASGPGAVADWSYIYPQPGEDFGVAVSGGGDINGDGYCDIALGVPGWGAGRGMVRVFYGSPAGVQSSNTVDLNPIASKDRYGTALAIFGDGNGDGFDDLAIGAPGNTGRVSIHYGAATGFTGYSTYFFGTQTGSRMGAAVAAAGDANGDGYADIIAGEPDADVNVSNDGLAHLLLGNFPTVNARISFGTGNTIPNLQFGQAVCGLGDPAGTGRSFVAVSQWDAGLQLTNVRVYEYTGLMASRCSFEITNTQAEMPMAGMGDIDGDGSPEIGFGLPNAFGDDGSIRVHGPVPAQAGLPPSARPRITTTGGDPIALRGLMHAFDEPQLAVNAWLPIGRAHLNMEWNWGQVRQAYSHTGVGSWTPSATHIAGTALSVHPAVPLTPGTRYRWRVRVLSTNPYVPFGPWLNMQPNCNTLYSLRVVDTATATEGSRPRLSSRLAAAIPNPFNPITELEFQLGGRHWVELQIFDLAGRLVRTLARDDLEGGVHRKQWDGTDEAGATVASGVYVAVLRAGADVSSLKLSLVK